MMSLVRHWNGLPAQFVTYPWKPEQGGFEGLFQVKSFHDSTTPYHSFVRASTMQIQETRDGLHVTTWP